MVKKPSRILIVRTDRVGDVILSTPVIRNLRSYFPDAFIAFMCRPYTREIVENNPFLDEVIVYDKYGKHKSLWRSILFAVSLRKEKFDWAIILHPTNRAHIVTFLAGIPVRVGWDRKMGFLLTQTLEHKKQEGLRHEAEYTLDLLRALNIPTLYKTLYFPIADTAKDKVNNLLKKENVSDDEEVITIHPSASCPSKRWPADYFSKLISTLKEKLSLKVAVITAKGEEQYAEKIVSEQDVIDLRGKLTLIEVGALLKRSAVFVSNDSGPVHIAAALEVPVISIFGRKDPGLSPLRWRPLGENSFYFHEDVGCTICLAHNCQKDFLCLKAIKPEEVAKKVILILKKQ